MINESYFMHHSDENGHITESWRDSYVFDIVEYQDIDESNYEMILYGDRKELCKMLTTSVSINEAYIQELGLSDIRKGIGNIAKGVSTAAQKAFNVLADKTSDSIVGRVYRSADKALRKAFSPKAIDKSLKRHDTAKARVDKGLKELITFEPAYNIMRDLVTKSSARELFHNPADHSINKVGYLKLDKSSTLKLLGSNIRNKFRSIGGELRTLRTTDNTKSYRFMFPDKSSITIDTENGQVLLIPGLPTLLPAKN